MPALLLIEEGPYRKEKKAERSQSLLSTVSHAYLADFLALLFESPAVCSAIRYGKARSRTRRGEPVLQRVTALAHERPRRLVIGHVLLHGLALTKQALDNSLSETGIAIRFSESVYLFVAPALVIPAQANL